MSLRRIAPALSLSLALALGGTLSAPTAATAATIPTTLKSAITAKPSAIKVYLDRKISISGTVTVQPGQPRWVGLETLRKGKWVLTHAATTNAKGAYSFALYSSTKGTAKYRVRVLAESGVTAATGKTVSVTTVAKAVPKSSTYSLLIPRDNGTWGRWNPCGVIYYRVNPGASGALAKARIADAKGAVKRVSQATGLRFSYRGTTTAVPKKKGSKYPSGTKLVIAWAKPGTSTWMPKPRKGKRAAAGVAGALTFKNVYNTGGLPVWEITQAGVVLDSTLPLAGGFGTGPRYGWQGTRGQLLMHEIAHAVGVGHTKTKSQIMYGTMGRKKAAWGKGDKIALRLVGKTQGCMRTKR